MSYECVECGQEISQVDATCMGCGAAAAGMWDETAATEAVVFSGHPEQAFSSTEEDAWADETQVAPAAEEDDDSKAARRLGPLAFLGLFGGRAAATKTAAVVARPAAIAPRPGVIRNAFSSVGSSSGWIAVAAVMGVTVGGGVWAVNQPQKPHNPQSAANAPVSVQDSDTSDSASATDSTKKNASASSTAGTDAASNNQAAEALPASEPISTDSSASNTSSSNPTSTSSSSGETTSASPSAGSSSTSGASSTSSATSSSSSTSTSTLPGVVPLADYVSPMFPGNSVYTFRNASDSWACYLWKENGLGISVPNGLACFGELPASLSITALCPKPGILLQNDKPSSGLCWAKPSDATVLPVNSAIEVGGIKCRFTDAESLRCVSQQYGFDINHQTGSSW